MTLPKPPPEPPMVEQLILAAIGLAIFAALVHFDVLPLDVVVKIITGEIR